MTVAEANAVNRVLDRLYGGPAHHHLGGIERTLDVPAQELVAALEALAAGAYKRLMAGWPPAKVRERGLPPALSARLVETRHVLEVRETAWFLEHTLTCRVEYERLGDCPMHERISDWLGELGGPPAPAGRYLIDDELTLTAIEVDERSCRVCGCTDLEACDPPCGWADEDLCTGCVEMGVAGGA